MNLRSGLASKANKTESRMYCKPHKTCHYTTASGQHHGQLQRNNGHGGDGPSTKPERVYEKIRRMHAGLPERLHAECCYWHHKNIDPRSSTSLRARETINYKSEHSTAANFASHDLPHRFCASKRSATTTISTYQHRHGCKY
jgi:hypothetical protein